MKQFKIRCSAIGQIMANSRTKGQLSKTAQSYAQEWLKEQIYGRPKFMTNKYVEKGLQMEDEAIQFVSDSTDYGFLIKNEESFENDFLTGTPDIITKDEIIDIKCSWDCFTFPLFYEALPNKDYYWQLQGYMELTNRDKASIVYCLMNTPEQFGEDIYDHIDSKYRIKRFEVERNDEDIEKIKERVEEINNYINQLNF